MDTRKYVIETNEDFRASNVMAFDIDAKLVEIIKASAIGNAIWTVETSLMASQVLLIRGVIRLGNLF